MFKKTLLTLGILLLISLLSLPPLAAQEGETMTFRHPQLRYAGYPHEW